MKKTVLFLILLSLVSCSRWRVSDLKPEKLFTIPAGYAQDKISLQYEEGDLLNVTFSVRVSDNRVYCADTAMRRLFIYSRSGDRELTIGPKPSSGDIKNYAIFDFATIGVITDDSDGNIYVQNRLAKVNGGSGEMSPSYVLVFDKEGKLEATLGQEGVAGTPFYYIDNMSCDDQNRLFVIGRSFESWSVNRYKGKSRDFTVSFDRDSFKSSVTDASYSAVIENILPFRTGDSVLLSVAFYQNTRFKFRKIYEYRLDGKKQLKEVVELPDPRNELFTIMDDKYFLLWEVDNKDVRFVIWSFQESIINNLRLKLEGRKSYFEQILTDERGKIYSYSVTRDGINIYAWE